MGTGGEGWSGESQEKPGEKDRGVGCTGAGAVWRELRSERCGAKAVQGWNSAMNDCPQHCVLARQGWPDPPVTTFPIQQGTGKPTRQMSPPPSATHCLTKLVTHYGQNLHGQQQSWNRSQMCGNGPT